MRDDQLSFTTRLSALLTVFTLALILAKATVAAPAILEADAAAEMDYAAGVMADPVTVEAWPDLAALPEADVSMMDIRIALAQLAQSAGANGQLLVLQAQAANPAEAVVIKNGALGLGALMAAMGEAAEGSVVQRPIVIWPGARLEIGAGDTLALSRTHGAFLLNFGTLVIRGGAVEPAGEANPRVPDFAPFVVTAGAGHALIDGARLTDLGFGVAPAFSGLAFVKGGLYPADGPTILANSVLENLLSVTLRGSEAVLVTGNTVIAPRRHGLELRNTTRIKLEANVIRDAAGNAIRLTNRAMGTEILLNRLYKSGATAIHVETLSHGASIEGNEVWATDGSAIALHRADCARVADNVLIKNRGKGLSLRTVRGAEILTNTFLGNTSAAIFLADQPQGTETRIGGNWFEGNLAGLSSATGDTLLLSANDFTEQFPRFLDGDLTFATPAILGDLTGEAPITLDAGSRPGGAALPPLNCEKES